MWHVTKLFCRSCIFFLFWKFWPEVPLNTLSTWRNLSMTISRPCEDIKVCAVSLYSVSDQRNCRQSRSTEDRVSGLKRHCFRTSGNTESRLWLIDPRHVEPISPWMTYKQPLAGATNVGPAQLNTCWFEEQRGVRNYTVGNKSKRAHCRLRADSGAADLEKKIRRCKKGEKNPPHHRVCVRRSGHQSGRCRVDSQWLRLIDS